MLEPNVDYKFRIPLPIRATDINGEDEEQFPQVSSHVILYAGEFNHGGEILSLSKEDLESMLLNFKSRAIGIDPPIDFSHEEHKEAAGWITGLNLTDFQVDDENKPALFATIKWSKAGREKLANKEYRYFSASFALIHSDGSTGQSFGPTLRGGALTNMPFLKRLHPIVELSRKTKLNQKTQTKGVKRMDTINLSDHKAQMKVFQDRIKDLESKNEEFTVKVADFSKIKSENAELKTELAKTRKEIEINKRETKFEKLLSEGKAVAAQRDSFMAGDMDKFLELSKPVNLNSQGATNGNEVTKEEMSAADKAMFDKFLKGRMTEEEFLKSQKRSN